MKEPLDSSALVTDASALRPRLASEGYLFFRWLLPVSVIDEVRSQIARILYDSH
jgi:hypothetical protein